MIRRVGGFNGTYVLFTFDICITPPHRLVRGVNLRYYYWPISLAY